MRLIFEGATEGVTGSCTLVKTNDKNILVDCGLYEGNADQYLNSRNLTFDPKAIDYILLTHAHIDHSGRIPYLVKKGFKGKVICTKPTLDLCEIMLPDSGYIQQKMKKWDMPSKKKKELILYDMEDAKRSLKYFKGVEYDTEIKIDENIKARFVNSGHMLGSAYIELYITENKKETKLVFTGDLGNPNNNMLRQITRLDNADIVIMESTYGDRLHSTLATVEEQIENAIIETVERKGKLIIPAFAVGRTQEVIVYLKRIYEKLEDKYKIPVYVDSPLAIDAFEKFIYNRQYLKQGITKDLCFDEFKLVRGLSESQYLSEKAESMIIVSASGMAEFGRIREHLKNNIGNEKNIILFSGYVAEGTPGRELLKGKRKLKINGDKHKVKAYINKVDGMSGHLDMDGLINFVSDMRIKPKQIYLNHGSNDSKENLRAKLKQIVNSDIIIPKRDNIYDINIERKAEQKEKFNLRDFYNQKLSVQERILFSIYGESIKDATKFQKDSDILINNKNEKQVNNLRKLGYELKC